MLFASVCTNGAAARDRDDHERAREAVRAGEIAPLAAVLARIERSHAGQVLDVELEREHDRWTYRVRLLAPDGRLLRIEADARTGEVMRAGPLRTRRGESSR